MSSVSTRRGVGSPAKPSTKWPRPENLPPLDEYFDKDTADAVIETMEAESKAQAAHAAALAGAKEGGSSAVVTPLAPGIARRGNVKRACKHPSFRNANYKGVKKELDEMGADAVGLCLIHPSSGAEDQLTLTWCLREGLYKHYVIEEFDKPTDSAIEPTSAEDIRLRACLGRVCIRSLPVSRKIRDE